jgi:hypothetical protein
VDERYSRIKTWPAGGVGIYDLEANPRARNRGPVDWVHYHVPRSTLDVFTDDAEMGSIETLRCQHRTVAPVLLGNPKPADESADPVDSKELSNRQEV